MRRRPNEAVPVIGVIPSPSCIHLWHVDWIGAGYPGQRVTRSGSPPLSDWVGQVGGESVTFGRARRGRQSVSPSASG
jgi:hypothetical protein